MVYVVGIGLRSAAERIVDKRLEEGIRGASDDAHMTRKKIDHVTIAGSDELDGSSISSMLLLAFAVFALSTDRVFGRSWAFE